MSALTELFPGNMRGHLQHWAVVLILLVSIDKGDISKLQQGVLAGFLDRLGWYAEFNQSLVELVSRKGFTPAPGPKGIDPGKLDTWPPV